MGGSIDVPLLDTSDADSHDEHLDGSHQSRLERACQHILAAYTREPPIFVRRSRAARSINWLVYRLGVVKWTALLCLVGLSLLERPVWCIRAQHAKGPHAPFPCDTDFYPGWGHKYMSLKESFMFEGVCLAVLLAFEAGHWFAGGRSYINAAVNRFKLIWLATLVADVLIGICTPSTNFRLAPFFRVALFATSSSDVRRELFLLVQVIPGLSSLMLLTLLNLLFFAFFGLVLFHDVQGAAHYFGTLGRAIWQLWVLQTTCNFPDIMIPVYSKNRASYFFFLAFILISTFFLMNLFTAVVFTKYTERQKAYEEQALVSTEKHLTWAFHLLDIDGSGELSKEEMLSVVGELRKVHLLPDLQGGVADSLLFAALDTERNNKISKEEFMELCTVLKVKWEEEESATYLERTWPSLYNSSSFQKLRRVVLSSAFQWGCDLTVLVMSVATVYETLVQLDTGTGPDPSEMDGYVDSFWGVVELAFTIFFTVEVLLKQICYGWRAYWSDLTNRLELFTAIGCVAMTLAVYLPNNFSNAAWIRYAAFLRLLRLLRLGTVLRFPTMLRFLYVIVSVEHIKIFFETFVAMLPAAVRLIKVMFCIIYVYAVAGVTFYGGLVTTDRNSEHYEKLASSEYVKDNYMLLNFNDVPSAMVLMVQLLVVNNWHVFAEAYVTVAGPSAWLLFLSFYGVGVIAGLNVLVSFVLDAFMGELESDLAAREDSSDNAAGCSNDDEARRPSSGNRAHAVQVIDGSLLADSTDVQGTWRAKMKGYETSSRKAAMLLRLIRKQKRAAEVSELGSTGMPEPHPLDFANANGEPHPFALLNGNTDPVAVLG